MNAYTTIAILCTVTMFLWLTSSIILFVTYIRQARRIRNLERALKDSIHAWEESVVSFEHKGYWVLSGERIEAWTQALDHK